MTKPTTKVRPGIRCRCTDRAHHDSYCGVLHRCERDAVRRVTVRVTYKDAILTDGRGAGSEARDYTDEKLVPMCEHCAKTAEAKAVSK